MSDLIPSAEHRSFDYIFSSHNFEHLPNPIKFLRACETLLKPGGRVIMMVPDCRICFDYFQAHTTLGEWLQAYLEDRKKPSLKQVYDFLSDHAHSIVDLPPLDAISDKTPRQAISVKTDIGELWENWQNSTEDSPYQEVHCTFMTPSSLELLIEDCRHLNLIGLEVFDVSEARGVEFKVHLVKPINPSPVVATANYRERRSELLHRIWDEHASRGNVRGKGIGQLFKRRQASSGQNALRLPLKEKLRSLNRRRLHRRRQK
ncbi:MAG: methyltransferase domain-containing protein [Pseudomonadota bacterium]